jgi:uncharacterized protein with beta-barrel porin domain
MRASSRVRRGVRLLAFGTALALAPAVASAQQACGTSASDFSTIYLLGSTPGRVFVTYDMFESPDLLEIYYGGDLVATTDGFVTGSTGAPLSFDYVPVGSDFAVVAVVESYDPQSESEWEIVVGCPVAFESEGELSVGDRATATSIASSQAIAVRQIFRTQTQNFTRRLQNLRHGSGSGRISISGLTLSYNGRSFSPDFGRGFSDRLAGGLIGLASAYSGQQDGFDSLPGSDSLVQRFTSPLLERLAARTQYAQFAQQHWAQSNWDQAWFKSRFQGEQTAQAPDGEIELPDRLGIFVNGIINFGDRDTTSSAAGFDFRNLGLSFGADYRITADLLLGIGGGVNFGRTDITGGSKSDVDGYNVTAYGSWRPLEGFYVDGQLTYTFLDFDLERAVAATAQRARGDRYGNQVSGNITVGYEHYSDSLSFGPYLRLGYAHTSLSGFTETGVAAPLEFEKETLKSLTTTLGVRGDYAISTSSGIVLPYLRAEYEHEFKGSNNPAIVRFAGVPSSDIALAEIPVDRNYFNLGGGVTFLMENAVSVFLDYETLLGFTDQSSHLFTLGIAARF